jgi:spermidine synthase
LTLIPNNRDGARGLSGGLCAAFLLTGAAALLFETLWFRLAGLALGNSIWASSAVLASLMAGLALGNGLAARFGERVARPLRLYAVLEAGVAATGLVLVLAFPLIADRLAPFLARWTGAEAVLNGARILVAFGLMLLPATAMGTTLPLLARALVRHDARFGVALGRLYGWNTLGGVAGVALGEGVLITQLGLSRTAVVAVGLNLAAAAIAIGLDARWGPSVAPPAAAPPSDPQPGRRLERARLLVAAFLGGAILLGLEIVWFRFLQLFVFGTQTVFALMLATVLAGIGLGGLVAAAWLRRRPGADHLVGLVALGGGVVTIVTYASFDPALLPAGALGDKLLTLVLSVWLMLPTSLVSGVLFTFLGQALRREMRGDSEAAGWLTLSNTVGASLGAPVAGLVLLPWLGVETTLFALAVSYLLAAWMVLPWRDAPRASRYAVAGGVALFLLVAAAFPFGLMWGRFVRLTLAGRTGDGARLVALREGLTATVLLLQKDWGGTPVYHRLITNAHSMTSTTFYGRRYMKLFAYWALALRPTARRALLISYGLGNTGEALTRSDHLTSIDVVDISPAILEISSMTAWPGTTDPLEDPRVRVHIEDGRFFLLTASSRYDIITAEPPPPRGAGVVNLYSLEYFRLVRRRLAPGGITTHWLPVNQLSLQDSRGIVRAFCAVFEDCTLWSGAGYDWMLAGTNGAAAPPLERAFARLWTSPRTGVDLRDLGIEVPEQLGALFVADSTALARWCGDTPPLVDDHPGRLRQSHPPPEDLDAYRELMDPRRCAERFASSPFIRRVWPAALREKTLAWFRWQRVFNEDFERWHRPTALAELWDVLDTTSLRTLPLLLLDSEPRIRDIARARASAGDRHPALSHHLGIAALAERGYEAAARHFAEADSQVHPAGLLRALALGLDGRPEEALRILHGLEDLPPHAAVWRGWLEERLERPDG